MPKKKNTLSRILKELGEQLGELDRQVAEIESQINHPERSLAERKKLRAHWEKTIDAHGLRSFLKSFETKERRQKFEFSGTVISEALYMKQQANYFERAGRGGDAKKIRLKAEKLEKRGQELRAREFRNSR